MRLPFIIVVLACCFPSIANAAFAQSPADTVRAVLTAPDSELSYERAKLAFDAIIAPELDGMKPGMRTLRIAKDNACKGCGN